MLGPLTQSARGRLVGAYRYDDAEAIENLRRDLQFAKSLEYLQKARRESPRPFTGEQRAALIRAVRDGAS
jgi:hypothetical protein